MLDLSENCLSVETMLTRIVVVCFEGQEYPMSTDSTGTRISYKTLAGKLQYDDSLHGGLQLVDGVGVNSAIFSQEGDEITVGHGDIFLVKNQWMDNQEGLYSLVELAVRELMVEHKSQKPRTTAPSEWTRSIGYSCQYTSNTGFATPAPFTPGRGISEVSLTSPKDKDLFKAVAKILAMHFPTFAGLFLQAGRVDVKYNSVITRDSNHFDKKDVCHQVFFSVGTTENDLCVLEDGIVQRLQGKHKPTAFDGRFQHWVDDFGYEPSRDRISIVSYLVDAPTSYRHDKMTMTQLTDHLTSK